MTVQADMEDRAREMLADAYEKAGFPEVSAAFRAGKWTCHDHPAYLAMLAFAAEREAALNTARLRELGIMDRVLTYAENAIYDAGMAAAYARAAEGGAQSASRPRPTANSGIASVE